MFHCLRTGYHRGTCSYHIVNEKNVLASQWFFIHKLKSALHILQTFPFVQSRLTLLKLYAPDNLGIIWNISYLTNTLCQHLTLIIASATLSFLRQRQWNNNIYIINGINTKDAPTVLASTTFLAAIFCLTSLVLDILYALVDPRVKERYNTVKK